MDDLTIITMIEFYLVLIFLYGGIGLYTYTQVLRIIH